MKREKFVNTELMQVLEEEIDLFRQGKPNIERAKAIANLIHKFIGTKRLDIQEEERKRRELLKAIKS